MPSSGEKQSYLHKHKDGERGILYNRNGGHVSGWLLGSEVDIFISSANTHTIRLAIPLSHYHAMVRNYISHWSEQTFYVVSSFLSSGFFKFVIEK